MIDRNKLTNFIKLRQMNPLTEWDDIKEGEKYHLPPLIFNKRMDFIVTEKRPNSLRFKKTDCSYCQTMFKTDLTTRFIVKKQEIHGST